MTVFQPLFLGWCALFMVSQWTTFALAYIPALASNDTTFLAGTPNSSLFISWQGGESREDVSYQLVGADSNGVSKVRSRTVYMSA